MRRRDLPRSFYRRDARVVAPELLNKIVVHGGRSVRLVEVEAYAGGEDPGSHAYRGMKPRNAVMFGPAGHLYVYFTYGMHWCANAVCGDVGEGTAVLLRAGEPLDGLEAMRLARGAAVRRDVDLANGPAKLCQALGIAREQNGVDLLAGAVRIRDDGTPPPDRPGVSPRIGLTAGADLPWRWFVRGDPHVTASPLNRAAGVV